MTMIWKYALGPGCTTLQIPVGGQVLTAQVQGGNVCIWVLVEPKANTEARTFTVYGTGWELADNPGVYVGTGQMVDHGLVWHVFETTGK